MDTGESMPNIEFNAATADSKLEHTFVQGAANGFYKIFSGGGGVSFEQLNTKATSSDITIKGHIDNYVALPVGPGGWYDSDEVNRGSYLFNILLTRDSSHLSKKHYAKKRDRTCW
jgi:hypothetical protein